MRDRADDIVVDRDRRRGSERAKISMMSTHCHWYVGEQYGLIGDLEKKRWSVLYVTIIIISIIIINRIASCLIVLYYIIILYLLCFLRATRSLRVLIYTRALLYRVIFVLLLLLLIHGVRAQRDEGLKKKVQVTRCARVIVYYYYYYFLCTKIIVNKYDKKITMIDIILYALVHIVLYYYIIYYVISVCYLFQLVFCYIRVRAVVLSSRWFVLITSKKKK